MIDIRRYAICCQNSVVVKGKGVDEEIEWDGTEQRVSDSNVGLFFLGAAGVTAAAPFESDDPFAFVLVSVHCCCGSERAPCKAE